MSRASRSPTDVRPQFETLEPRLLLDAIIKGPYLQQPTPDSMVVMWETDVATGSRVDYGLTGPNEFSMEDSTPVTIHEMELTGLTPDATYDYTVTSFGDVTSDPSTFATAPATERSFRFVAYGDTRTNSDDHAAVIQGIINSEPEFVLHTGDLVSDGNNKNVWGPEFFTPAHDLMIDTPMLPIIGNHEGTAVLFCDFFSLPNNEQWFAYTYSNVRFIGLNTHNASYSPGSDQYNWLLDELQSSEYTDADWQIVYFHHPPYTATSGHSDTTSVQTDLVPLFEQYDVDLVFNGHSHVYERYFHNDIYYIVTGGGGAPLTNLLEDTVEPIRQFGERTYHHCVIDVDVAGGSLTLSARYNNGLEFDTITLGPDVTPPTLDAVSATSQTTVQVVFSEPVEQTSAELVTNYVIDQGVEISSALLQADTETVVLTVSTLSEGVTYTLTVNGVTDRATEPNPIAGNTQQTFQYAAAPLVAYWALDDGGGTTAADSSGNGNDGTLKNGAAFTASGISGGAVLFDGTDDYVQVESTVTPTPPLGLQTFTLAAWFNRAGDGDTVNTGAGGFLGEPLVTKGRGEAEGDNRDMNYFLGLTQSGGDWVLAADFEQYNNGQNYPVYGATAIPDGQWHHAAVTYDGSQWNLYLDGSPDGASVVNKVPNYESIQYAAIGGALNSSGVRDGAFNGTIDEVYIFEGALSQQEIIDLMAQPPTATIITPEDNGPDDLDPADGAITVNTTQSTFQILLSDVDDGVNDATVTSETVALTKNEVPFANYSFGYEAGADLITLTPTDGDFGDGLYEIVLSGAAARIADLADPPNEMVATTLTIEIDTSIVTPQTLTFQQGVDDYTTMADTMIRGAQPDDNFADSATQYDQQYQYQINSDRDSQGAPSHVLLRFDDIIGTDPGQIDPGSTVVSATLRLRSTDDGNGGNLHPVLLPWVDTVVTWNNSFGGDGVQADDVEAALLADDGITQNNPDTDVDFDVAATLQAWADGAANDGWAVLPGGTNGWHIATAEHPTLDWRPELIVTFLPGTPNDPPVAVGDSATTDEETAVTIDVLANDSDPDLDTLTVASVTQGGNGTVAINPDDTVTYTPDPNFNGSDSFTYTISDGNGGTDTATVSVTVTAVNDPPVANDQSAATDEDTAVAITLTGSDVDEDSLTYAVATPPVSGTLIGTAPNLTYTPDANFNGTDTFTFTVDDGNGGTDTAIVSITVNPVNDLPAAVDDAATTDEDTPVLIDVLANDSDPDGDGLTVESVTQPANGTVVNNGSDVTYTPDADFNGADTFTYTVGDGQGGTDTATVTVTVMPVDDAPVAVDDGYNVDEDSALIVAAPGLLSNDTDADGDPLSAVLVSEVSKGSLTLNADGSFDYTPAPDYFGPDSFTYKANDTHGDSNVATVSITVNAVKDAPVAADDAYTADEDILLSVPALGVLANDSDPENDPLTAVLVSDVSHGSLMLHADGSFDYTAVPDYFGPDSFTYKAKDSQADSNVATVSITVNGVNDAPVAAEDAYQVDQDNTLTIDAATGVLANDTDVEDDPLSATLVSDVSNGSLTLNPDGSFDYTPNAGHVGADSFTYTANDGNGGTDTATVTVTVNPSGIDDRAVSETTVKGSVISGDLAATYGSDGIYEAIREEQYAGGKRTRLEHTWEFNVTGGATVTFYLEAHHDSTVEDFAFAEYSTDGGTWTTMLTVTQDTGGYQTYLLPASTSGTVLVRVTDTDRSNKEGFQDIIYVDDMFIRSEGEPGLPVVTIAATDANAAEQDADPGTFTVTRTGDTGSDLVVNYTAGGTATEGADYAALTGTATILAGDSSATITITPVDDELEEGTETVNLTLAPDAAYTIGSPDGDTVSLLDNDLAAADDYALSESTTLGTVTDGDYTSTVESDNVYEALSEAIRGNKSLLEHTWTFDVTGGSTVTFNVEAHHDRTEDNFVFQYSTDGSTWTDMLTVTKTSDDDALQTAALPGGLSGTLYVRVIDTNRVNKETTLGTLYVDQMFIHCE